jgi:transcription initiation factor TFIID subunit TAF12
MAEAAAGAPEQGQQQQQQQQQKKSASMQELYLQVGWRDFPRSAIQIYILLNI